VSAARPLRRTPFTVIGGFLGAGKTTLVNHLLDEAGGAARRLAVLVNDFGAVNIDAASIGARTADTIALSNGCVCCQIGDDLTMALVRVLDAPDPFDAIIVEASGVSDPWRIAQIARADPALTLEGVVVLVDADAALAQAADPLLADTFERQLRSADLVVLNKIDLARDDDLAATRAWIADVAGKVTIIDATRARVPLALLVGDGRQPGQAWRGTRTLREAAAAHGIDFESSLFRPQTEFAEGSLRALLAAMPDGVLRLKGLLRTDRWPWAEIQFSGRHGSLREALEVPSDGAAAVVAIGLRGGLPNAELARHFGLPQ